MSITPNHQGSAIPESNVDEHKTKVANVLQKFLPLISKSNDIYFIVDAVENRFLFLNDAITEVLGFSPNEAVALQPKAFVTNASMDAIRDAIPRALAAHAPDSGDTAMVPLLHIQLIAKDRTRIPAELHLTVSLNQDHTASHYTGVAQGNFTRPAREKHGEVERLLGEIFTTLPIGCLVCSSKVDGDDFILLACNRAAEKMTGITAATGIGREISELLPELHANDIPPVMKSVAQSGIAVKLPVMRSSEGGDRECREYYICRLTGGAIVTFFGDSCDLRQQVDSAKGTVESLSVMAGKIGHDFNNIASLLFGQIELALGALMPESEAAQRLQPAMQVFERMRELTGRLSVLSRKTPLRKKAIDIGELIHTIAVSVFRGTTGMDYTVRMDAQTVEIIADGDLLGHALRLLLENARAAMNGEGTVSVAVDRGLNPAMKKMMTNDSGITITINDTGCGIAPERQSQLFTPIFSDDKSKRSQNGLAVVHSIIRRHGGTVTLESAPGRGTTVTIGLPTGDDAAESMIGKKDVPMARPVSGPGRVLIMDDEEILLDIATQMCRRIGLDVTTAENSHDAVEKYRDEFREGNPYDLVMLDLTIPGGSGGMETAAVMKKIDPEVKTVAMSGYTDHKVMADPSRFGFTAVLNKPFRLSEIGMVLKSILPADKFRVD